MTSSITIDPGPDRSLVWLLAPALSIACWTCLLIVLPPSSLNFPLADDWAFGPAAFQFAAGQGVNYYNWASMPLLGQWLWAVPFIRVLGNTYFAIRLSVLVLSWLGLAAFYDLLIRSQRASPAVAVVATIALAVAPLFFLVQGTFMTDIPSLSFALLALALGERGCQRQSCACWLAGSVFAALAVTNRQNMLIVPVAMAWALSQAPNLRQRAHWWAMAAAPLAMGLAVYAWFQFRPDSHPLRLRLANSTTILVSPFIVLIIGGLTALPVILLDPWPRSSSRCALGACAMTAAAAYWFYQGGSLPYGGTFPYIHGMITPTGAYSENLMPGDRPVVFGKLARWILTALGVASGAMLIDRLALRSRPGQWTSLEIFSVLQLPFLFLAPLLYDRYFLVFLPGALAIAARAAQVTLRIARLASVGMLLVSAMLSVCLMHDWLAWNIARWQLGNRAVVKLHLKPQWIEGGFEWDGSNNVAVHGSGAHPARLALPVVHPWFPLVTGDFAISFTPLPSSTILDREPFDRWLPPGRHEMLLPAYQRHY